ncbi:MAG: hypothetical protein AB7O24_13490 [Kofleriaceae bacterium]
MSRFVLAAMVLSSLAGCGGGDEGSGLSTDKKLLELTATEQDTFCTYVADMTEGPRTVMCNDQPLQLPGKQECLDELATFPDTCMATVGLAETCWDLVGDDPCNFLSEECVDYYACGIITTAQ